MSSDEVKLATLSDSSDDDIGFLSDFASKLPRRQIQPGRTTNLLGTDDVQEPDWVRDFTPQKRNDTDQKAALLASLGDEDDDDDSVINLISQELDAKEDGPIPDVEVTRKAARDGDPQQAPSTAKRARTPARPRSKLPLTVAPKLDDSLVLLQSVDGNLDLSGDVGAVGRVKVEEGALLLDIKGVVYRTSVIPCNTVCVVSVGDDEARVTAVLDETVTMECERNLFASDEIVVQGDLDEEHTENNYSSLSDGGSKEKESKSNGNKKKASDSNARSRSKTNSRARAADSSKGIGKLSRRKA